MPKEHDPEREMENLSKAIVEAILASEDVKKTLEKLNSSEETLGKNFMVFMVSLDSLNDAKKGKPLEMSDLSELPPEISKPRRRKPVKKQETPDHIDGKPLSDGEKSFQEMMSDQFDSEEWLKRLKLRFD